MKHRKNRNPVRKETLCMSGLCGSLVGLILAVMRMEATGISLGMMLVVAFCLATLWLCSYQLRYQPAAEQEDTRTVRVDVRADRAA